MVLQSESFETDYANGIFRIRIPGQKRTKLLFLLGAWLLFWLLVLTCMLAISYGASKAIFQEGRINFFPMILLIPLTLGMLVWVFQGVVATYTFFWEIAGKDIIVIGKNILTIQKTIFGIGRRREYERDRIINITLTGAITFPFAFLRFKFAQFEVPITGQISVSLKGVKTEYLGLGLEQEQAEKIIAIIQKQLFPDRA